MNAPKPKTNWLPLALLLPLLMTACAGQPVTFSADCPKPPQKPLARQQKPPQDYSASAAQDIEQWQQQLQATLPISNNVK